MAQVRQKPIARLDVRAYGDHEWRGKGRVEFCDLRYYFAIPRDRDEATLLIFEHPDPQGYKTQCIGYGFYHSGWEFETRENRHGILYTSFEEWLTRNVGQRGIVWVGIEA